MTDDRLFLEPRSNWEEGLTASIETEEDGGFFDPATPICISVAEEKAVDSYNQSFTCAMHLSIEQAAQLRDWLSAAIARPKRS